MKCSGCGFTVPAHQAGAARACMACGKPLAFDSDDFLLHGANALVKEVRPGQVNMGRLTENVIEQKNFAVVEGPVGIGKSFGYSIPAILSGKRIVISTAKKQLQHQLAGKDLPYLIERLESKATVTLLKGKSNYACELKAQTLSPEDKTAFLTWLKGSKAGDLTDWPGKKPQYWSDVTAEDCVGGSRCKFSNTCGYWRAKDQIKTAQIVVANHHVVAWDLRFGPKKLLGDYQVLIIDEAHQAVSAFRGAYTQTITPFTLKKIIRQIDKIGFTTDLDKKLEAAWINMFNHIKNLDGETPAHPFEKPGEEAIELLAQLRKEVKKELADEGFADDLDPDDPDFDDKFRTKLKNGGPPRSGMEYLTNLEMEYLTNLEMLKKAIDRPLEALQSIQTPDDNDVVFINTTERGHKIVNVAPIDVGPVVGPKLLQLDTVIITSATLAVADSFEPVKRQLGLNRTLKIIDDDGNMTDEDAPKKKIEELVLQSPFDYHRQALLYTPYHLPLPVSKPGSAHNEAMNKARDEYIEAISKEIKRLLEVSQGNAFVLFTSTQDMKDVGVALRTEGYEGPVFMQEDDAESTLKQFMATPHSTVLGLKSFWEGVDVVGAKLQLVVITKLPFPQVKDPVIQAQSRVIKKAALERGQSEMSAESDVFKGIQIPMMLTDLRQGAGRLIRSINDRGVLAILDPRIWTGSGKKLPAPGQRAYLGYGAQAVNSIGFSQKTGDFILTSKFLTKLCNDEAARVAKKNAQV